MPPRPLKVPAPAAAPSPLWLKVLILVLAALMLTAMFSAEMGDPDTWFHFAMGKWVWQNHKLPVPDPFGWTTYMGQPAYPEEPQIRDFNLRHEWLGQVVMYLVFAAGGPAGMVLFRVLCVIGFCAVLGWVVYRRTGEFYAGLLAALAASTIARTVAIDRPFVVTYLLLTLLLVILEQRKRLWLLPILFVFWANFHGGYFVGWVLLGAYGLEALIERQRSILGWCVAAFLASGLNPTFFGIIPGMLAYRQSALQRTLREWHSPSLSEPSWQLLFLVAGIAVLLWARKRARAADWLMFLLFGAFSTMAIRNVIFAGFVGPLVIFSYLPVKRFIRPAVEYGIAVLLVAGCVVAMSSPKAFQFHEANWQNPRGAIRFLKQHDVRGPMFNLYEWGGYLMWEAWPQEKTFVDGRALNESVFKDYLRIAHNYADAQQLLDKYGVEVLLVQGFEYGSGSVYKIGPALADPTQTKWKLAYQDANGMLFLRQLPPGVAPLDPSLVFASLDAGCKDHLDHRPDQSRCALGLGDLYARLNLLDKSVYWLERYIGFTPNPDVAARRLYQQIKKGSFVAPGR